MEYPSLRFSAGTGADPRAGPAFFRGFPSAFERNTRSGRTPENDLFTVRRNVALAGFPSSDVSPTTGSPPEQRSQPVPRRRGWPAPASVARLPRRLPGRRPTAPGRRAGSAARLGCGVQPDAGQWSAYRHRHWSATDGRTVGRRAPTRWRHVPLGSAHERRDWPAPGRPLVSSGPPPPRRRPCRGPRLPVGDTNRPPTRPGHHHEGHHHRGVVVNTNRKDKRC